MVSSPDYEVTIVNDAGVLRIAALGTFAVEPTKRLFDRVARDARHCEAKRVLLDLRGVVGRITTMERFELGVYAAARIKVKVALVGLPETIDHFGETVAINRGAKSRVFTDETEALSWLLSERGPLDPKLIPYNRG
jgi:hypothetical protein